MKPNEKIMEYRRRIPRFIRESSWNIKSIGKSWRKPKGIQSKMRKQKRGKPGLVKVGYRMPNKYRGLHKSGRKIHLVSSTDEIDELNPKEDIVEFPSTLGLKKKSVLVKHAKKKGIYILNINPDKYLSKFKSILEKKEKKRKEIEKKRKEMLKSKKEEKEKEKSDKKKNTKDSESDSKKSDSESSKKPSRNKEKSEGEKIKEDIITKSN